MPESPVKGFIVHNVPCVGVNNLIWYTWTSKTASRMDPILPVLFLLVDWAIVSGTLGGQGLTQRSWRGHQPPTGK